MTDRTHPDSGRATDQTHIIRYALELGLLWIDGDGRDKVREALDALDTLEAQLASAGFTAADMATASAQGFRNGVASLSASAPAPSEHIKKPYTLAEVKAKIASNDYSAEMLLQHAMLLLDSASLSANAGEPVVNRATVIEWLDANDIEVTDRQLGGLFHFSAPPTAQAEGWLPIEGAPKDRSNIVLLRQPCGSIANGFWLAEAYAGNGAWIWPYVHKTPTHWIPLPPPPTSAEGVEHG